MDLNAISNGEDFRREHGITRTRGNDRPLFHDHHMIGKAGGQSEVMQYDDNACSIQRTLLSPIKHVEQMSGIERSDEHKSELQSLMRISYAVLCLHTQNEPLEV